MKPDRRIEEPERAVCRLCGARYWIEHGHRCRYEDWEDWDWGERRFDCDYEDVASLFIEQEDI